MLLQLRLCLYGVKFAEVCVISVCNFLLESREQGRMHAPVGLFVGLGFVCACSVCMLLYMLSTYWGVWRSIWI